MEKKDSQLLDACEKGNLKEAGLALKSSLFSRSANIEVKNDLEKTPVILAAEKGFKEILELLAVKKANLNAGDSQGCTALMMAVQNNYIEIVELLLEQGADIDIQDNNKKTALHHAVNQNSLELVKLLVNKRANVNLRNSKGWTPLINAVIKKQKETVKILIDAGTDVNIRCNEYKTAFEYAGSTAELKNLLKDAGTEVTDSLIDKLSYADALSEIKKLEEKHTYQHKYGNLVYPAILSMNFFKEITRLGFKKTGPFRKYTGVEYADWASGKFKLECASIAKDDDDQYSIADHITSVNLFEIK